MAKYPEQCTKKTTYSIGVWDDRDKYPFDLIFLNSRQHSENNLELMMMTYLLNEKLAEEHEDREKYSLDDHGCRPIVVTMGKSTLAISFIHGKWQVECDDDSIRAIVKEKLSNDNRVDVEEEGGKITVKLKLAALDGDIDYIDLGQYVVGLFESVAETLQTNNDE